MNVVYGTQVEIRVQGSEQAGRQIMARLVIGRGCCSYAANIPSSFSSTSASRRYRVATAGGRIRCSG